jgi:putative ABC transport system permease protein
VRWGLFTEILVMSWDTLRGNKLRSALTVLGIVIGITSIVGITSLVRGFDETIRSLIREIGPDTIFVQKFSGMSQSSAAAFQEIMKRPNLTPGDAEAIEKLPSVQIVDIQLGGGGPGGARTERITYRSQRTKPLMIFGSTERWPYVNQLVLESGRYFNAGEVQRRQNVVVLGQTAKEALFPTSDPIGKLVRVGLYQYTVVGVMAKRPSVGDFGGTGPDDFAVVPLSTYQKQFGIRANLMARGEMRSVRIAVVPHEDTPREQAMAEIESEMRIRHGLRLDEPNDFDLMTQDSILQFWGQITQAVFLALVVISSIALMVGGIGVMSIMTISVTERTREIGVRKALGARRTEILWQFLLEAVFLTSAGGVLGIIIGSGVGFGVHWLTGFPVSLPWWSFAIGIGFSAGVGVFFGMVQRFARRLDPLRPPLRVEQRG